MPPSRRALAEACRQRLGESWLDKERLYKRMRMLGPKASIPEDARGAAIALGNFDGVHAGHQAVLASTKIAAAARGAKVGAAVFEPHPRRFFHPETPPFRIQSPRQRANALGSCGADEVFEFGFDAAMASLSAEEFAKKVLHDCLGAVHVSVGQGFRFGRGREGDADALIDLGKALGFSTAIVAPVAAAGAPVSSTRVRAALASGDLAVAGALLTRPWAVEGVVQRGFSRGRTLGFPTANLHLGDYVRPRLGIYATRVDLGDGVLLPSVASVGVNPTVGALPEPVLETHLLDFDGNLYGKTIEVEFIAFLRDELNFPDTDALRSQMRQDVLDARRALVP